MAGNQQKLDFNDEDLGALNKQINCSLKSEI